MIYVKTNEVSKETLCSIQAQFEKTILSLKNTNKDADYLNELLSDAERLVLAKRLATIMMLTQEHSWTHIQETLQTSRSTIGDVACAIKGGHYDTVIDAIKRSRGRAALWSELEYIVRGTR